MTERRYTDEESTTIFQLAAEGPSALPHHPSHADGLTLADLKSIGLEVGISPDAVAHAAQMLEVRQGAVSRTLLGLPIGVERRVTLRHGLTDEEWKQLVVPRSTVSNPRSDRPGASLSMGCVFGCTVSSRPLHLIVRLYVGRTGGKDVRWYYTITGVNPRSQREGSGAARAVGREEARGGAVKSSGPHGSHSVIFSTNSSTAGART